MKNSFGTLSTLNVGGRTYRIHRLEALEKKGYAVSRLPYALRILLENLLRCEDGFAVTAEQIESIARWDAKAAPVARDRVHARARAPAGLHGRAGGGGPRGHALGHEADGGRPEEDQPALPGRARHRPLGAGRRVRDRGRLRDERREGIRAQPRAVRVPALGADGAARPEGGPARHGHRPPGEPRVPRPGRHDGRAGRRGAAGLPRHGGRHRLAHDHDQRHRRARLGRGRDRGGGGDAGPADVDADPAGRRRAPARPAGRGGDRDRPRAHGHPPAPQEGGRREVRRVLRPGAGDPAPRRPGDARQHGARVRGDVRHLPGGRREHRVPAPHGPPRRARRARRGVHEGAGALADRHGRGDGVHGRPRPGPRLGAAEPRGAEAAPGPRAARRGEEELPRRARGDEGSPRREGGRARGVERGEGRHRRRHRPRRDAGDRPRRGRDRRDHLVHQHLEPLGDDGRRASREEGRGRAASRASRGSRPASGRARRRSPIT